ncbi:unnamed protein product [Adineta ricciae]|uniref:Uncharacterized protein n=1 Tax=Adineta ricciae TaxID=249248 RepID=A0A815JVI1_ADIRI|nr:unnamed protein product [Adineta ricciae]
MNINSCSIQPLIPIWMVITGSILLLPTFTAFIFIILCFPFCYCQHCDKTLYYKSATLVLFATSVLLGTWSIPVSVMSVLYTISHNLKDIFFQ